MNRSLGDVLSTTAPYSLWALILLTIFGWLRELAEVVAGHLRGSLVTTLEVSSESPAFEWLDRWLAAGSYGARARNLKVSVLSRYDEASGQTQLVPLFTPGNGVHLFLYRYRLVLIRRTRLENKAQGEVSSRDDAADGAMLRLFNPFVEQFTLTLLSRDRDLARALIDEARAAHYDTSAERTVSVQRFMYSSWEEFSRVPPVDPEHFAFADGLCESLFEQVDWFLKSRDWYHQRGLPHRMGILLHGRPGNGKTSLVSCLASRFRLKLCLLSMADLENTPLSRAIAKLPPRALVLIEDVDCARVVARRDPAANANGQAPTGASLSEVLNALDGVMRSEGYVLMMTSNHPQRLDPALVRPGRIDHCIELRGATGAQAGRLLRKFFPDVSEAEVAGFCAGLPAPGEGELSLALLQGHLVQHARDRAAALRPDWAALAQRQRGFPDGAKQGEAPRRRARGAAA